MFDEVWQGMGANGCKSSRISVFWSGAIPCQTFVKPKSYGACPNHFRATRRRASEGGSSGYDEAGYHLVAAIGDLAPYDVEGEDWGSAVAGASRSAPLPTDGGGMTLVPPDDDAVLGVVRSLGPALHRR